MHDAAYSPNSAQGAMRLVELLAGARAVSVRRMTQRLTRSPNVWRSLAQGTLAIRQIDNVVAEMAGQWPRGLQWDERVAWPDQVGKPPGLLIGIPQHNDWTPETLAASRVTAAGFHLTLETFARRTDTPANRIMHAATKQANFSALLQQGKIRVRTLDRAVERLATDWPDLDWPGCLPWPDTVPRPKGLRLQGTPGA